MERALLPKLRLQQLLVQPLEPAKTRLPSSAESAPVALSAINSSWVVRNLSGCETLARTTCRPARGGSKLFVLAGGLDGSKEKQVSPRSSSKGPDDDEDEMMEPDFEAKFAALEACPSGRGPTGAPADRYRYRSLRERGQTTSQNARGADRTGSGVVTFGITEQSNSVCWTSGSRF